MPPRRRQEQGRRWGFDRLLMVVAILWFGILMVFSATIFLQNNQQEPESARSRHVTEVESLEQDIANLREHVGSLKTRYEMKQAAKARRRGANGGLVDVQRKDDVISESREEMEVEAEEEEEDMVNVKGKDGGNDRPLRDGAEERDIGDEEELESEIAQAEAAAAAEEAEKEDEKDAVVEGENLAGVESEVVDQQEEPLAVAENQVVDRQPLQLVAAGAPEVEEKAQEVEPPKDMIAPVEPIKAEEAPIDPVVPVNPMIVYDSDTSPVPLVDPTVLTRKNIPFDGDLDKLCKKEKDGNEMLLDRVTVWDGAEMAKPRILCMSYTLSKVHDTAVRNIQRTWGPKCDGYIAMSDLTDPEVPSIDIKHEGPEAYNNMWQKTRSIWMYVDKHHAEDFDYFYLGGDDIYLIVENLRKYLVSNEVLKASENATKPLFMGRRFLPPKETIIFNSGGAGYLLNRPALKILGKGLRENIMCRPHQVGFWEDVNVANCLYQYNVTAFDTRDPLGRERFHPFTPENHLYYRTPPKVLDWYAKYTLDLKEGYECCSEDSLSFHYVKGDLMLRMYALVYRMCPK